MNANCKSQTRSTFWSVGYLMDAHTLDKFHFDFYQSGVWANTFWRGERILKFPTDMIIYQEIIHEVMPDLIVECGTRHGGSAVFLGDMCKLIGHGRIVSIDIAADRTPIHSHVEYIAGDSGDPVIVTKVNPKGTVLVILDSDHAKEHVLRELEVWSPFITSGSYIIVEDTNLSGHPVCAEMPTGPWEAVEEWLSEHPEFTRDRLREKFQLTANPGGYLRRL